MVKRFLCLVGAVSALACGGQEGPTDPDLDDAEVTARIDGVPFASNTVSVTHAAGAVTVTATAANPTRTITFTFPDQGSGTFPIGAGMPTSAGLTMDTKAWVASGAAGGGSISVTTSSATSLVGTFTLGLTATGGQTPANVAISQGIFDIEL